MDVEKGGLPGLGVWMGQVTELLRTTNSVNGEIGEKMMSYVLDVLSLRCLWNIYMKMCSSNLEHSGNLLLGNRNLGIVTYDRLKS